MASNFKIYSLVTRDRLHLRLTGDFDGSSAFELINIISKHGKSFYEIFIDTNDLNNIHSFGREVLEKKLGSLKNQLHCITFVGRNRNEFFADLEMAV